MNVLGYEDHIEQDRAVCAARKRDHYETMLRECFRRKLSHAHNDCETMQDCCRKLKAAGEDVTEELKDAVATISALLLVVRILQREQRSE